MKGALLPGTEPDTPRDRFDAGTFYREHRDELLAFFDRAARRAGLDAEGVLHDTWVVLSDQYERGQLDTADPAGLVAWCKLVGTRIIRDQLRGGYHSHEQPHLGLSMISSELPDAEPPVGDARQAWVDPEQQWVDRADLRRAVAKMPPKLAAVFVYDDAGYSRDEIADILGISPAAVKKRLTRARAYARNRLGKIVAALFPVGAIVSAAHSVRRTIAKPSQTLVASIASVSVVAAFSVPIAPAQTIVAKPPAQQAVVRTAHAVADLPIAPAAKDTTSRPRAPLPEPAGAAPRRLDKPAAPRLVPHVPTTCAPHICVGSCSAAQQAGDTLYLKAGGPCGIGTTENVTPLCPRVVENPVVGCQRQGKPQWTVDPPPPPRTEGVPL